MFYIVARIIEKTGGRILFCLKVHDHLMQLSKKHYFPIEKDPKTANEWICNRFVTKPGQSTQSLLEEEQLIEIANDDDLRFMFETTSNLFVFKVKVKVEYSDIAAKALKALLLFPTTNLCEAGFSAVKASKTRLRSRLDIRNTI